ncbi:MAG: hypothetical protein QOC95_1034, partial [Thermoleophilaceae bacterium]|nr:hypothetical protein [Thermoleophilaceae bacterium]
MLAIAASLVLGLSVTLLPWYALSDYRANGWDATWWARAAAIAAITGIVLVRRASYRLAAAAAALALACVIVRVASPPDFGFGFDGLMVPVERRVGCWVALGSALLALLACLRLAAGRERLSPEPPPAASSA